MTIASRMLVPRTGVLAIDMDHEQLHTMLEAAQRAARLGDVPGAAESLDRAARLAELHAQEEEDYLSRCNFDRLLDIRREHERLVVALEELRAAAERPAPDLAGRIAALRDYLSGSVRREAEALRRFLRRVA